MNAEQVVEKILAEAKAQAGSIVDEAKAKAAEQKAGLDSNIAGFDNKTQEMAKDAAEDKLQRMLASARMNNARQTLAAKVEILDDVFEKAKAAVLKLGDEQYLSLMTALVKKAVETGDEEIIVSKNEKRIDTDFVKKVNRELGAGFKGNLRLSDEKADITGGFILTRGKVRVNASTDVMIDALRETMGIELLQQLFTD